MGPVTFLGYALLYVGYSLPVLCSGYPKGYSATVPLRLGAKLLWRKAELGWVVLLGVHDDLKRGSGMMPCCQYYRDYSWSHLLI